MKGGIVCGMIEIRQVGGYLTESWIWKKWQVGRRGRRSWDEGRVEIGDVGIGISPRLFLARRNPERKIAMGGSRD